MSDYERSSKTTLVWNVSILNEVPKLHLFEMSDFERSSKTKLVWSLKYLILKDYTGLKCLIIKEVPKLHWFEMFQFWTKFQNYTGLKCLMLKPHISAIRWQSVICTLHVKRKFWSVKETPEWPQTAGRVGNPSQPWAHMISNHLKFASPQGTMINSDDFNDCNWHSNQTLAKRQENVTDRWTPAEHQTTTKTFLSIESTVSTIVT